jgi:stage V sporulation protein G
MIQGKPRTMHGAGQGGVMEVTEVKIFPVQEDRLKAYAAITFDNCFIIRDLKVINGNNGLFVAMPSKKRKDGSYRDTAHPLNNETRQMIESKVLEEYNKEVQKSTT